MQGSGNGSSHLTRQQVHDAEYVDSFCSGVLDAARLKRIGFGEVARSPVLIERTLAEVAGVCRFRLYYGDDDQDPQRRDWRLYSCWS